MQRDVTNMLTDIFVNEPEATAIKAKQKKISENINVLNESASQ